jgi:hypothetical protein
MSLAGSEDPPKSPPGRAAHCALVGGYMRKEQARAARAAKAATAASARGQSLPAVYVPAGSVPRGPILPGSGLLAGLAMHDLCGRELARRFLAKPIQMSFAGPENPPKSPPARAPHCALVGGYTRKRVPSSVGRLSGQVLGTSPRQPSQAAFGPVSYIAALAWCPTVCRGTDDCGEHHPSTAAARALRPGPSAASGKTPQAQGNTPSAPRGGRCGCLAARQTSTKPPGVPTGWGRLRAEPPGRASSLGA